MFSSTDLSRLTIRWIRTRLYSLIVIRSLIINFVVRMRWDANLSRANLYGANLSDAILSGADLSDADLSDAVLSGADLSRAVLFNLKINNNAPSYVLEAVSLYMKIRNILTTKKTSEEIGKEIENKI